MCDPTLHEDYLKLLDKAVAQADAFAKERKLLIAERDNLSKECNSLMEEIIRLRGLLNFACEYRDTN